MIGNILIVLHIIHNITDLIKIDILMQIIITTRIDIIEIIDIIRGTIIKEQGRTNNTIIIKEKQSTDKRSKRKKRLNNRLVAIALRNRKRKRWCRKLLKFKKQKKKKKRAVNLSLHHPNKNYLNQLVPSKCLFKPQIRVKQFPKIIKLTKCKKRKKERTKKVKKSYYLPQKHKDHFYSNNNLRNNS